ncbi:MAG: hypothetical protein CVU59_02505 [Deltaproteobacteria bacterium HGW-Deltaproteobacteria-17]|nr:MAG: hypothetical protein CVU59_02505 [Deltaproteobacteria bacterium HGW-Deltaproteobacteria-17]
MSAFSGFWIGLVILAPVLGLTLACSVFGGEAPGEALLRGGGLALPLSVAGAIVTALVADRLPERGRRSWLTLGLTILLLALSFFLLRDWVIVGGTDVRLAATEAVAKNGFYVTRQLWEGYGAWSLLLLPVLILTLVLDSIVLVFLPLFHGPFWSALGLLLLRVLGWLALGGGLGAALTAWLVRTGGPPGTDDHSGPPDVRAPGP